MRLFIMRTNIQSEDRVNRIRPHLNIHPQIKRWSIDFEDIDHVLKIEASCYLQEHELVALVNGCGFDCEELPD